MVPPRLEPGKIEPMKLDTAPINNGNFKYESEQALRSFAARKGRYWKAKLYDLWCNGRDYYEPEGATLRAIRNHPRYGYEYVRDFKP